MLFYFCEHKKCVAPRGFCSNCFAATGWSDLDALRRNTFLFAILLHLRVINYQNKNRSF